VGADGVFVANEGAGSGTVQASFGEWAASSAEVSVRAVLGLEVSPTEPVVLADGETVQFTAELHHSDGTTENVTEQAKWTWGGSSKAGSISKSGQFTGGAGCDAAPITAKLKDRTAAGAHVTVRNVMSLVVSPEQCAVLGPAKPSSSKPSGATTTATPTT